MRLAPKRPAQHDVHGGRRGDAGCAPRQLGQVASGGTTNRQFGLDLLNRRQKLHLDASRGAAVNDLVDALPKIGVIATRTGGTWFISPVRTYVDLDLAVLSNLEDDDLLVPIKANPPHDLIKWLPEVTVAVASFPPAPRKA